MPRFATLIFASFTALAAASAGGRARSPLGVAPESAAPGFRAAGLAVLRPVGRSHAARP